MTDISRALRERLAQCAEVRAPEVAEEHISADGTRKWLVRVTGGSCVETVFIPEDGRGTLCVSSQVGCALDCSFCSTGKQGFQRDLTAAEIIGRSGSRRVPSPAQARRPAQHHQRGDDGHGRASAKLRQRRCRDGPDDGRLRVRDLQAPRDAEHGRRRAALERLAAVSEASLAISLHAPNDALRDQLVRSTAATRSAACSMPRAATWTRRPTASA